MKVPLIPNSVSLVSEGFRSLLPNCDLLVLPETRENVSYCHANDGRIPAVPCATRTFNSSNISRSKSSVIRYAAEIL